MDRLANLLSPIQIGNLVLRNRIVMPAMHLGYCPNGEVTDKLIEFYRQRAQGGVGLVIVGGCGIDRIGNAPAMIQVDDDQYIPGLTALAQAVQGAGAKIMAQLYQSGRYASSLWTGQQPVAPSPIPSKLTRETPRELTVEEIKQIVQSFALAAERVKKAGFDGVEILAGTGYLISEFLSPVTNKRTDEYGGDLQNRMRFALEVVAAIREKVGPDYPLLARIAGNDFIPGGHTNKEARLFAQALEKAGVTAINVTGGWHETEIPQITMNVPPAAFRYLARGIKQAVSIPVIASNRITSPELAEEIIASGDADLVALGRPLIADPFYVAKAINGEPIRPCIGCNQGCLDHIFQGKPVACLVNPEAGRESKLKKDTPQEKSAAPKRFLVIGGGAAGLEFARNASLYGHYVEVWEKEHKAGGQLHLAAAPPRRQDFHRLTAYLEAVCESQGVKIVYGQNATPENILQAVQEQGFNHVVLATGARPHTPPLTIDPQAPVVQAWDVLAGKAQTAQNVVIVGGGAVGVETALYLAEQGALKPETLHFLLINKAEDPETIKQLLFHSNKKITLIEMTKGVGRDIGSSTRWAMIGELKLRGVNILTNTTVKEIRQDGVWVQNADGEFLVPSDTTVLAIGSASNNELHSQLQGKLPDGVSLHLIGDALKPAKAFEAIHSAYKEAAQLV